MENLTKTIFTGIGIGFLVVLLVIVLSGFSAFLVKWAWNGSVAIIFGWKIITAWEGFWLGMLTSLLFAKCNYKYEKK